MMAFFSIGRRYLHRIVRIQKKNKRKKQQKKITGRLPSNLGIYSEFQRQLQNCRTMITNDRKIEQKKQAKKLTRRL